VRIVHVEDFIHPDAGYQVNLLARLQVRQGHEVIVVTSELDRVPAHLVQFFGKDRLRERDERFERRTGVRIIRVPLWGFYSGRAIYRPGLKRVVDGLRPDVAMVHGEDTLMGIGFILRAARLDYPIVLDCHMVEMASRNRLRGAFRWLYRHLVTPSILRHQIPLIRVVDVDFVEKCLGIPLSKTVLLGFGTDTDAFKPDRAGRAAFRQAHGFAEDDFLVLYAGKLDVEKGGAFLAEALFRRLPSRTGRRIRFLLVGNTIGPYGAAVEATLEHSENAIRRFPTQAYLDLLPFYQGADLALFPRQCSMSFFEAQACGLPVLFENNEVNLQRSRFGNAMLFEPGDVADFREQLARAEAMAAGDFAAMGAAARRLIVENYDYVPIAQKFTDILEESARRFQGSREGRR